MTIKNALEKFMIYQKVSGNSPKTIENYYSQCNYFIDFLNEDIDLNNLTMEHLNQYVIYLQQRQLKAKKFNGTYKTGKLSSISIQSYIRQLRTFINFCYHEEYIITDLGKRLRIPKAIKKIFKILTKEEIETLFNNFDFNSMLGYRNAVMIILMLDCGFRISEVINLKLYDVNFEDNLLTVLGKGNKERIVPMGNVSKKYLKNFINSVRINSKYADLTNNVFFTRTGQPIRYNTIKCYFARLRKQTNIERLHPHLLRHTFATMYLINGGDTLSLQKILGHTSLKMAEIYVDCSLSFLIAQYKKYSPVDSWQELWKGNRNGHIKENC